MEESLFQVSISPVSFVLSELWISTHVLSRLGSSAPARVSIKKIRAPKEKKATVSKWKGTSQGPKPVVSKIANLRCEDGSLSAIKSPTPTETSSEEEDSSSEEESEYEDDEEIPVQDISEVSSKTRTEFFCMSASNSGLAQLDATPL